MSLRAVATAKRTLEYSQVTKPHQGGLRTIRNLISTLANGTLRIRRQTAVVSRDSLPIQALTHGGGARVDTGAQMLLPRSVLYRTMLDAEMFTCARYYSHTVIAARRIPSACGRFAWRRPTIREMCFGVRKRAACRVGARRNALHHNTRTPRGSPCRPTQPLRQVTHVASPPVARRVRSAPDRS